MFNSNGYGPITTPFLGRDITGATFDFIKCIDKAGDETTVLSEDLIARDIILIGSVALHTGGYKIYCRNLTISGNANIMNHGGDGVDGGIRGPWGSLCGGGLGGYGGTRTVEGESTPQTGGPMELGSLGGSGGHGGNGVTNGGTASFNYTGSNINFGSTAPVQSSLFTDACIVGAPTTVAAARTPSTMVVVSGGGGGGGGKANSAINSNGGAGGGGGGVMFITASGTVSMNGGSITANGGQGQGGYTAEAVTGGGGGGGGGGCIIINCNAMSLQSGAVITASGGGYGAGGGTTAEEGADGSILINTPNGLWRFVGNVSGYSDFPIS